MRTLERRTPTLRSPKNCWEVKGCGREGCRSTRDCTPSCPAALAEDFDGANRGRNAGRMCWLVAGTLSSADGKGVFAGKQLSCLSCDFYRRGRKEEGPHFRFKPPRRAPPSPGA